MPDPIKWLFNATKQIYQRFRGDKREVTVKVDARLRDSFQDNSRGWAADLTDDLYSKRITIQQWQSQFRIGLKGQYTDQYLAAIGGRENMTQADWGRLGGLLKFQYTKHNKFAQDIVDGKMSHAQARYRAGMYQRSSVQAFERARVASVQPEEILWVINPAVKNCPDCLSLNDEGWVPRDQFEKRGTFPRSGDTQCMMNCYCTLDFRDLE